MANDDHKYPGFTTAPTTYEIEPGASFDAANKYSDYWQETQVSINVYASSYWWLVFYVQLFYICLLAADQNNYVLNNMFMSTNPLYNILSIC